MDTLVLTDPENQEIELLKQWLPSLSAKERAYFRGAAEALLYAQGEGLPPDTDVP